jgi:hypothetical protein
MLVFEESGFRVELPEDTGFRFADLRSYRALAGRSISEMDFGWIHAEAGALCLMEVKDYSEREPPSHLLPKLIAKGRDCLLLLQAAWSELSGVGRDLRSDLPAPCRDRRRVRLFFVLKRDPALPPPEARLMQTMQDKLKAAVGGYADILGAQLSLLRLMDQERAIQMRLPISIITSPGT